MVSAVIIAITAHSTTAGVFKRPEAAAAPPATSATAPGTGTPMASAKTTRETTA